MPSINHALLHIQVHGENEGPLTPEDSVLLQKRLLKEDIPSTAYQSSRSKRRYNIRLDIKMHILYFFHSSKNILICFCFKFKMRKTK